MVSASARSLAMIRSSDWSGLDFGLGVARADTDTSIIAAEKRQRHIISPPPVDLRQWNDRNVHHVAVRSQSRERIRVKSERGVHSGTEVPRLPHPSFALLAKEAENAQFLTGFALIQGPEAQHEASLVLGETGELREETLRTWSVLGGRQV